MAGYRNTSASSPLMHTDLFFRFRKNKSKVSANVRLLTDHELPRVYRKLGFLDIFECNARKSLKNG
jgi:hypothetical protein